MQQERDKQASFDNLSQQISTGNQYRFDQESNLSLPDWSFEEDWSQDNLFGWHTAHPVSQLEPLSMLSDLSLFGESELLTQSNEEEFTQKGNKSRRNNIAKFLVKMFIKYLPKYESIYRGFPEIWKRVKYRRNKLNRWMNHSHKNMNNINLSHLGMFLYSEVDAHQSLLNRQAMKEIIKEHSRKEIIENPYIKEKMCYLKTVKVFALRCENSFLVERLQCP